MTAPVYQHLTSSNGVAQRCCWTRWNRPPSAVFGSGVALLVGTAILIAACVSQSHASGLAQIADIDDVMQQQVRKRHLLFIRRLTFHARGRLTCEVKLSPTSIDTQMESLRSKISSAFVGLTTASQALGGANSFSYAAFYQVARHLAGQGAFPLISIRNLVALSSPGCLAYNGGPGSSAGVIRLQQARFSVH